MFAVEDCRDLNLPVDSFLIDCTGPPMLSLNTPADTASNNTSQRQLSNTIHSVIDLTFDSDEDVNNSDVNIESLRDLPEDSNKNSQRRQRQRSNRRESRRSRKVAIPHVETPSPSEVKVATETDPPIPGFDPSDNSPLPTAQTYDSSRNNKYRKTLKDFSDWKFEKLDDAVDACGGDRPNIELFADNDLSNSVLEGSRTIPSGSTKIFSPAKDAFSEKWTDGYFYGNPDYNDTFINRTLTKALWDFSLDPFNTRFMFVLPNWKTASWYPLLRHFDIKKTYSSDTQLFSAKSIPELNPSKSVFTDKGRVIINSTSWQVLIIYKDCNTVTKIDAVMKLHLMFGHKSALYIKEAIKNNSQLTKLIGNVNKLDVPIFCAVCNAAKSRSTKAEREFPLATAPFQSLHCDLKVYALGSNDGYQYIFGIIDSYTRYAWIFFLRKKSEAASKLESFCDTVLTTNLFPIKSLQGTRLIADNAKEFTGNEFTSVCKKYLMEFSTTAEYKHTDNAMIESFWRNEQVVRSMLLGAPHMQRRLWPYAWTLATSLHNSFPHKYHGQGTLATTDIMQQSPWETMTGELPPLTSFKPFGLPMKIHIPVEKRNMQADPKLIERSFNAHFLCNDPKRPTKIIVQNEENGNVYSTGFFQPMYSTDTFSRIVSNMNLQNTIDLDTIEEKLVASQIPFSFISHRKKFQAKQILDISVCSDENDELIGAVYFENSRKPNLPTDLLWTTLDVFLHENKEHVFKHKNMLFSFTNKHFAYRENEFYPIFVQTDVRLKTPNDKKNPIKIFPGMIIGTDSNSSKGYFTALYENTSGQENVCDLHDCAATDIVQFEVAKILAPCYSLDASCWDKQNDYYGRPPQSSETLFALLNGNKPISKRKKTMLNDPTLPQSYKHAMSMPDKDLWQEAFDKEINGLYVVKKSFLPVKTEDLYTHKDCKKILNSSIICKRKLDKDGNVKSYKVRLVVGGNGQHAGDGTFDDTFAPTASLVTQRLCFALAVNLGLKPYQLDVEQAFLNADIDDKTILVRLPAGILIDDCSHVKLLKAVYGLKQSPNLWYKLCHDTILSCESRLTRSKTDPCFFHYVSDKLIVLLTVTVDDIAIFTNDDDWLQKFKKDFNKIFAITQEPDFSWFLGTKMEWSTDYSAVKLTQPNHIRGALIRYNMMDCKPQNTPMSADYDSSPLPEDHVNPDFPFSGIIGTLIWIARNSRPDILVAVTLLATRNKRFNTDHIKAAKRILAYLKGTENYGIIIRKEPNFDISKPITLKMYTDSDWARDKATRRSVTGYVGYFMGSPIVTQCKYQPTVANSSSEAEYMAASNALKEILYFTNVFKEIELLKFLLPVSVLIDNSGAISMASTPVSNKNTKHIDIRHHFIRDAFEDGTIFPLHVPTDDNTADLFTKPLADLPFIKHRDNVVSAEEV